MKTGTTKTYRTVFGFFPGPFPLRVFSKTVWFHKEFGHPLELGGQYSNHESTPQDKGDDWQTNERSSFFRSSGKGG